jgi:hypothetical protein
MTAVKRVRRVKRIAFALACLLWATLAPSSAPGVGAAFAQVGGGQVGGLVIDPDGAAVPGAAVVALVRYRGVRRRATGHARQRLAEPRARPRLSQRRSIGEPTRPSPSGDNLGAAWRGVQPAEHPAPRQPERQRRHGGVRHNHNGRRSAGGAAGGEAFVLTNRVEFRPVGESNIQPGSISVYFPRYSTRQIRPFWLSEM